jgi:hypothetical protein
MEGQSRSPYRTTGHDSRDRSAWTGRPDRSVEGTETTGLQNMIAGTGQLGQENLGGTARIGQVGQDKRDNRVRTGQSSQRQAGQNSRGKTAKTMQLGQDSRDRIAWTGQPRQGSLGRSARHEQDSRNRTIPFIRIKVCNKKNNYY